MKKFVLVALSLLLLCSTVNAQSVNLPDVDVVQVKAIKAVNGKEYRAEMGNSYTSFEVDFQIPYITADVEIRTYASGTSRYKVVKFEDNECSILLIPVKEKARIYNKRKLLNDFASHYFEIDERIYLVLLE